MRFYEYEKLPWSWPFSIFNIFNDWFRYSCIIHSVGIIRSCSSLNQNIYWSTTSKIIWIYLLDDVKLVRTSQIRRYLKTSVYFESILSKTHGWFFLSSVKNLLNDNIPTWLPWILKLTLALCWKHLRRIDLWWRNQYSAEEIASQQANDKDPFQFEERKSQD